MYRREDIQFVGRHDYEKTLMSEGGWNKTFSVGIFKWELKSCGRLMKKSKALVRVSGAVEDSKKVYSLAETVVCALDSGVWDGRKTVVVK